jgi:uncharacterized protein VirK/YbjX
MQRIKISIEYSHDIMYDLGLNAERLLADGRQIVIGNLINPLGYEVELESIPNEGKTKTKLKLSKSNKRYLADVSFSIVTKEDNVVLIAEIHIQPLS